LVIVIQAGCDMLGGIAAGVLFLQCMGSISARERLLLAAVGEQARNKILQAGAQLGGVVQAQQIRLAFSQCIGGGVELVLGDHDSPAVVVRAS
jgi:hypothetical protein